MVWTWGWRDHTIGIRELDDLVHWAPQGQLAVMANEPGALNVVGSGDVLRGGEKRWLIFWSSTIPGGFGGRLGRRRAEPPHLVHNDVRLQDVRTGEALLRSGVQRDRCDAVCDAEG